MERDRQSVHNDKLSQVLMLQYITKNINLRQGICSPKKLALDMVADQ